MLVVNELNILFLLALEHGVATIMPVPSSGTVLIQEYEAGVDSGDLRGVRVMLDGNRAYDYCAITPHAPK